MMKRHLKESFWDWILCTCISLGLLFHIYSGFVLEDPYSGSVLKVLAFAAVLTFLFVLAAYSKKTVIAGICVGVAAAACFLVYVRGSNPFADETANSTQVFLVLTVLTCAAVFLAARTRAGIAVLFAVGNLVIGGSAFLQFPVRAWGLCLFLFAEAVLFLYRVYKDTLLHVFTGKVRIVRYMIQTLCVCLAAFLAAGVIFLGVVRPLDPPTQELKLITKLESMKLLQVMGISSTKKLLDPSLRSSAEAEGLVHGKEAGEEEEEREGGGGGDSSGENDSQEETSPKEKDEEKDNEDEQKAYAVGYQLPRSTIIGAVIGIFLFLVFLCVLRVLLRKRWYRAVDALDRESGVVNLYRFFCKKLKLCGYQRPGHHTLYEYARDMEHELEIFAQGESSFSRLTHIYVRVYYGRCLVTEEEYGLFARFYRDFYKHLRREIGIFRYLIRWPLL